MNADVKSAGMSSEGISDAINKIMEHPELISMVASALSGNSSQPPEKQERVENVVEESETGQNSNTPTLSPELLGSVMPMISKLSSIGSKGNSGLDKRHEQLLCALKLYVSPARREAIDYILKFSQMSGLFQALK